MSQLILGSSSPYRKELLQKLGLNFVCMSPGVDESAWKSQGLSARDLCLKLAGAKAQAIILKHSDATVIGSDQVALIDEKILDKPGNMENAKVQLRCLSGRTHELLTAITVLHAGQSWQHIEHCKLTMRKLEDDQIERYLKVEQPFDCCGSYKLESLGISLFEKVDTLDPSAIMGLPLIALTTILNRCGWRSP